MSHNLVGFFAGGLYIDENTIAQGTLPDEGDGKVRIFPDSILAGGSAATAAITFAKLAGMDPSNGKGSAHLYTYSEKKTPDNILHDLESHGVHLKKLGIIDRLPFSTIVAHTEGRKLLLARPPGLLRDFQRTQDAALDVMALLRQRIEQAGMGDDMRDLFARADGSIRAAFLEANDHLPHPALNADKQFRTDLEGSDIVMVDMMYPDITLRTTKEARALGKPVMLDLGRWADHANDLIDKSTVVIASHDFTVPGKKLSPPEILDYLRSRGVRQAAVTRGAKPTLFYDDFDPHGPYRGEVIVPKEPKLVNTSSAGDVQHGTASYFLGRGHHLGEALYQANRVSSFSVAFPDKRQFFKYLRFDLAGNLHIDDPFAAAAPRGPELHS